MKAIIRLDVPDWQIGEKVSIYFPDSMVSNSICEIDNMEKDCISREDALYILSSDINNNSMAKMYYEQIKSLPSVTPQSKTGHWIDTGSGQECSKCHEIQYSYDNHRFYCSNCGAKMEETEE